MAAPRRSEPGSCLVRDGRRHARGGGSSFAWGSGRADRSVCGVPIVKCTSHTSMLSSADRARAERPARSPIARDAIVRCSRRPHRTWPTWRSRSKSRLGRSCVGSWRHSRRSSPPYERPWLRVVRRRRQNRVRHDPADGLRARSHRRSDGAGPTTRGRCASGATSCSRGGGAPCASSPLPLRTMLSMSTYQRPDCVSSPSSSRRAASAVIAPPERNRRRQLRPRSDALIDFRQRRRHARRHPMAADDVEEDRHLVLGRHVRAASRRGRRRSARA